MKGSFRKNTRKKLFYFLVTFIIVSIFLVLFVFIKAQTQYSNIGRKCSSEKCNTKDIKQKSKSIDVTMVGNSIWIFLHSSLANRQISDVGISVIIDTVKSLPEIHPCGSCRNSFHLVLEKIRLERFGTDREGVSKWVCELHNEVNIQLGKSVYSCDIEKLDQFWSI